jgi:RHS repeat-associated protein
VDYGNGGATYTFDGNGLRVKRSYGSTTVYILSGTRVIAEYTSGATPTNPTKEYIYSGGLLASIEGGTTKYHLPDHLSTRMTMANGTTTEQGHYPFGESWYGSTAEKWKFTTYERDTESGNDYANFRSYVSRYGRFLTPDPLGTGAVDPTNPQTWNRYAYVINDPVNYVDPLGLCPAITIPGHCSSIQVRMMGSGNYGCTIDGVPASCGLALSMIGSGAGYPQDAQNCRESGSQIVCGTSETNLYVFNPVSYIMSLPSGLIQQYQEYADANASGPRNNAQQKRNVFTCASEGAGKVSLANALHHVPGLKNGIGGFIADAVGGNAFSGATDLVQSIATGEGGGHSAFYNMGQGVVAGPTLGFGAALGKSIEGTPWASGPMDAAMTLAFGEYATGVGEAKLIYDGVTYLGAAAGCIAGVIP